MTPIEVYRALHKKMCTTAAADPNSDGSIPLSKEEFTKATDGAEKSKCCTKRALRERVTRVESKAIMNQVSRICREAGIELAAAPATNDILEAAVVFLNGGGSSSSKW